MRGSEVIAAIPQQNLFIFARFKLLNVHAQGLIYRIRVLLLLLLLIIIENSYKIEKSLIT